MLTDWSNRLHFPARHRETSQDCGRGPTSVRCLLEAPGACPLNLFRFEKDLVVESEKFLEAVIVEVERQPGQVPTWSLIDCARLNALPEVAVDTGDRPAGQD